MCKIYTDLGFMRVTELQGYTKSPKIGLYVAQRRFGMKILGFNLANDYGSRGAYCL